MKEDDGTESSKSNSLSAAAAARNRKKKKNRKKTKVKAAAMKSSEDNLEEVGSERLYFYRWCNILVSLNQFEDEVERSVREVNKILGKAPAAQNASKSSASSAAAPRSLLMIEARHLNPDNEMKRIFGSRVVDGHHRHDHQRQRRGGGGGGGRVRAQTRGAPSLIAGRQHNWPRPTKTGLSMRFLESDSRGGCQYFAFEHSASYQAVQRRFYGAVESMNPDFIVQLLNEHPFHVDAMLQLSDICKMGEDAQMATELVERTLFAMEAAFHTMFSLTSGTSRLDYRRQENR